MYEPNIDPKLEPLENQAPHWFLSTHPDGKYAARQVIVRNERAAVWDAETGQIVWEPQNANALCWIQNGQAVLAALEDYDAGEYLQVIPDGENLPLLRDEYPLALGRFSWPEGLLLDDAPLDIPAGWVCHLVASPTENKACVVWRDQTEAGIEWVAWDTERIWQEPDKGYFGKELNGLHTPVFSPNGKRVVLVYAATYWWENEDENDPEGPSPGGTFRCGKVVVCNSDTGAPQETEIWIDVPPGFLPNPDDEESDGFDFVKPDVFVTNEQFTVRLGNEETRTFSVV